MILSKLTDLIDYKEVKEKIKELKSEEPSNFLLSGPYLGITFGLTLGALRALRVGNTILDKPAAKTILKTTVTFGLGGLAYALTGYHLCAYFADRDRIPVDGYQDYRNRFVAGNMAGVTIGLLERKFGFGVFTALLLGGVSVLDLMLSRNVSGWKIDPIYPPGYEKPSKVS
jgi:hypothetical protein